MFRIFILVVSILTFSSTYSEEATLSGSVTSENSPAPFVNIYLKNTELGTSSNKNGWYELKNIPPGKYTLIASTIGYISFSQSIVIKKGQEQQLNIDLKPSVESLDEMVVTGTMKPVSRLESPVPVEVYKPTFFKKNPTASIFEALQNVNGVRPQINCSVCNTGDIHINGLEGPYTLVLIDGMPIVSGLGTVYGLSGIPNSLIEQIEIVKGPASTLYGSEAVGGLINIIRPAFCWASIILNMTTL
mgnify:FL=1